MHDKYPFLRTKISVLLYRSYKEVRVIKNEDGLKKLNWRPNCSIDFDKILALAPRMNTLRGIEVIFNLVISVGNSGYNPHRGAHNISASSSKSKNHPDTPYCIFH